MCVCVCTCMLAKILTANVHLLFLLVHFEIIFRQCFCFFVLLCTNYFMTTQQCKPRMSHVSKINNTRNSWSVKSCKTKKEKRQPHLTNEPFVFCCRERHLGCVGEWQESRNYGKSAQEIFCVCVCVCCRFVRLELWH